MQPKKKLAIGPREELATMENKFLKKTILTLLAATTIGLSGCSDVEAKLPEAKQEEPILNVENITNNNLQQIYEALVTAGDTNSEKVLDNILYIYAKSLFGSLYDTLNEDGTVKEEGLLSIESDDTKIANFIKTHTIYETVENCKVFIAHIKDSILNSFYSVVTNSSYQKRSVFKEEKFFVAQTAELFNLNRPTSFVEKALDGEKTYKDAEEYFTNLYVTYQDYIERSLLPTAYRKTLVEQYLLDNNYGALGRSYARKVQYIALPDIENKDGAALRLVRAYAEVVLSKTDEELKGNGASEGKIATYRDLHFLDKLYKGYFEEAEEKTFADKIYKLAGFKAFDAKADTIATYEETSYGKVAIDYNNLTNDRNKTGSTTDFTSSGAYTKEIGLDIKTKEINATTKVTQGWYTSSGLSDLASSIKTRLFKISVANEVDVLETNKHGNFGWNVNGSYYMVPETYESNEKYPYCMYDKDSKTWYIVKVEEAVKAPKLSIDSDQNYTAMGKSIRDIALNVASLLSDTDSYKKAARQYYVEKMALSYHDQEVYNYFKTTFPDLFD